MFAPWQRLHWNSVAIRRPWATFAVNLAGPAFLAWLKTRLTERTAPTRYARFLLGTGFCGAWTTFSAFQVETIRLAKDGHAGVAAAYAAASLAAGMLLAVGATVGARRRRYAGPARADDRFGT